MSVTEADVLRVLSGTPTGQVADQAGITETELAAAVAAYRAAGRTALDQIPRWLQLHVRFTAWDNAERVIAEQLAPHLDRHTRSATLSCWWFIRKHPSWRLRFLPGSGLSVADVRTALAPALDSLAEAGAVTWWETRYEPEALLFGGDAGIAVAHSLFHTDSVELLRHRDALRDARRTDPARASEVGRRELSSLLCCAMVRAARQDHGEHADVWHRVAQARTGTSAPASADQTAATAQQVRALVTADTSPDGVLRGQHGPLRFAADWIDAFTRAGAQLADAARDGALTRGLRAVLADHVIFHWNRFGLSVPEQAHLALATREALLPTRPDP